MRILTTVQVARRVGGRLGSQPTVIAFWPNILGFTTSILAGPEPLKSPKKSISLGLSILFIIILLFCSLCVYLFPSQFILFCHNCKSIQPSAVSPLAVPALQPGLAGEMTTTLRISEMVPSIPRLILHDSDSPSKEDIQGSIHIQDTGVKCKGPATRTSQVRAHMLVVALWLVIG